MTEIRTQPGTTSKILLCLADKVLFFGGVLKSMLTLNEAIIDVKEG